MAALEALPLDVTGVALTLANGCAGFPRQSMKPAMDNPMTPINAVAANMITRFRRLPSLIVPLKAVSGTARLSVGWPPRSISACTSNDDDCESGCVIIGAAAALDATAPPCAD